MPAFSSQQFDEQLAMAVEVIDRWVGDQVRSIHLFGSAIEGGLKPLSDIDLLVSLSERLDPEVRRGVMMELLNVSAMPGKGGKLRPLEVTMVCHDQIVPWRYPAKRELQFGEWLRAEILAGKIEAPVADPDLAVLLTKVRRHSLSLRGSSAADMFDPVPLHDFRRALIAALDLWHSPADWRGDERNVVLTLARIWFSFVTSDIAPKDAAAAWALERTPPLHVPLLRDARAAYLEAKEYDWGQRSDEIGAFVAFVRSQIEKQNQGILTDQLPERKDTI